MVSRTIKILTCAWLALACGQDLGAEEAECSAKETTRVSVLTCADFRLLPADSATLETEADFEAFFNAPSWETRAGTQWRFPGSTDVLWIRFSIRNPASAAVERWLLNEFAFADSLILYHIESDRLVAQDQGLQQPWEKKVLNYRLPAFSLRLIPGSNRFLLRVEARSGKLISLKLEGTDATASRETFPGYLYSAFVTGALAAFVLSLFVFLSLKERVGLLYCIYIATLIGYLSTWEGYARQFLFPDHGEWTIPIISCVGAVAGWAVITLWRSLLILGVHAPRMDSIMRILSWGYLSAAVYSALPFADFRIVDIAVYILPALFIPLAIISGIFVIRIGFKPAVFSLAGFAGFLLCIPFFFYAGMGLIPGSDYTRNPMYLGYFFEFSMFLVSVGARIHLLQKAPTAVSETAAVASGEANTARGSRLRRVNVQQLSGELDAMMREESLYCDEDLSQERLASLLGISRHQLSELIRVVHKTNFYGYINALRVDCARRLLILDPDRTILSIALASGFNSKSTFNSEFKKQTGKTPGAYRREHIIQNAE